MNEHVHVWRSAVPYRLNASFIKGDVHRPRSSRMLALPTNLLKESFETLALEDKL